MNVIICDDDICYQNAIVNSVDRWVCEHHMQSAVVTRCFSSTENFLAAWQDGFVVDVAFLDIEMPGELSGLEVARIIRQTNDQIAIAFICVRCGTTKNVSNNVYGEWVCSLTDWGK